MFDSVNNSKGCYGLNAGRNLIEDSINVRPGTQLKESLLHCNQSSKYNSDDLGIYAVKKYSKIRKPANIPSKKKDIVTVTLSCQLRSADYWAAKHSGTKRPSAVASVQGSKLYTLYRKVIVQLSANLAFKDENPEFCIAARVTEDGQLERFPLRCNKTLHGLCASPEIPDHETDEVLLISVIAATSLIIIVAVVILIFCIRFVILCLYFVNL
ncbi:hypothetical protein AM593_00148, partial [Mytilus galloprovincialis]